MAAVTLKSISALTSKPAALGTDVIPISPANSETLLSITLATLKTFVAAEAKAAADAAATAASGAATGLASYQTSNDAKLAELTTALNLAQTAASAAATAASNADEEALAGFQAVSFADDTGVLAFTTGAGDTASATIPPKAIPRTVATATTTSIAASTTGPLSWGTPSTDSLVSAGSDATLFTIPKDGLYALNLRVKMPYASSANRSIMALKNSAKIAHAPALLTYAGDDSGNGTTSTGTYYWACLDCVIECAAGDTLLFSVYNAGTSAQTITSATVLIARLGD